MESAATVADGAIWNPLPGFDGHLDLRTTTPQNTQQKNMELFGSRAGPQCIPHEQQMGATFDALMRGLEQQPYAEVFSYKPAYEPLNWTLPSAGSWPEMTSSSSASVSAPRPVRAEISNNVINSLDSYTYPTSTYPSSSNSGARRHSSSSASARYDPLAARRNSAPKGSASISPPASQGHQHQCSACPCKFARARDLTRHFRLHTGERPYECAGCNERFIRVDARKRHWNNRPACHTAHHSLLT